MDNYSQCLEDLWVFDSGVHHKRHVGPLGRKRRFQQEHLLDAPSNLLAPKPPIRYPSRDLPLRPPLASKALPAHKPALRRRRPHQESPLDKSHLLRNHALQHVGPRHPLRQPNPHPDRISPPTPSTSPNGPPNSTTYPPVACSPSPTAPCSKTRACSPRPKPSTRTDFSSRTTRTRRRSAPS